MTTVVFACVHNAGRSQIAAALFNHYADPAKARAISAGTRPAERVHPEVVEVMKARGLDLSTARPRKLTDDVAAGAGWLITMGCGDECPVVPGVCRDEWPLLDPKGQSVETVTSIAGDIDQRVREFVAAHGWQKVSVRA